MITLSAQIQSLNSRVDRSWRLTLGTQELTPDMIGTLGSMQNQVCFVAINPDPFTTEQKAIIENTKAELSDNGKTHGQRLRGVIFRNWEQDNEGYKEFHDYYLVKMEKIITHFKQKLL
jgi:hypothetical protein